MSKLRINELESLETGRSLKVDEMVQTFDYEAGIKITSYSQMVRGDNGEFWRVSGQVDLPYITTGAGVPEDASFVPVGDAALRSELASIGSGRGLNLIDGLPFVTPEQYDSIYDAVQGAGVGGVIKLQPTKTYEIIRSIRLLEGQTIFGNGATIKRVAQAHTTTTQAHSIGDTVIQVTDATGFVVGMGVAFGNAGVARGDLTLRSPASLSNPSVISDISGNSITLSGVLNIDLDTGSNMFTAFHSITTGKDCTVTGVNFDGNSSNWLFGGRWETTCEIRTGHGYTAVDPSNLLITGNRFKNAPGDCVTVGGTGVIVTNNFFHNVQGNPIHMSGLENALIHGNYAENANLDLDVGHQDGFVAYSNASKNMVISNNIAINCLRGVGPNNYTNGFSRVFNNTFLESRKSAIAFGRDRPSEAIIEGNYISGFGAVALQIGDSTESIKIINNTVINPSETGLLALDVGMRNSPGLTPSIIVEGNLFDAPCDIYSMAFGRVSNNTFNLENSSPNVILVGGRVLGYDAENCLISGNIFKNCTVRIGSFATSPTANAVIRNFVISGNLFKDSQLDALCYAREGSNCSVIGNKFEQSTGTVIKTNLSYDNTEIVIRDNEVRFDDSDGIKSAFHVTTTKSTIENNVIHNEASRGNNCIVVSNPESASCIIANNLITGTWGECIQTLTPCHIIRNITTKAVRDSSGTSNLVDNTVITSL